MRTADTGQKKTCCAHQQSLSFAIRNGLSSLSGREFRGILFLEHSYRTENVAGRFPRLAEHMIREIRRPAEKPPESAIRERAILSPFIRNSFSFNIVVD
jgi:hypothetical protein